jgi:hypothetical protein
MTSSPDETSRIRCREDRSCLPNQAGPGCYRYRFTTWNPMRGTSHSVDSHRRIAWMETRSRGSMPDSYGDGKSIERTGRSRVIKLTQGESRGRSGLFWRVGLFAEIIDGLVETGFGRFGQGIGILFRSVVFRSVSRLFGGHLLIDRRKNQPGRCSFRCRNRAS